MVGSKKITLEKIEQIIKFTEEGLFRREIANKVDLHMQTVFNYQKKFDLI